MPAAVDETFRELAGDCAITLQLKKGGVSCRGEGQRWNNLSPRSPQRLSTGKGPLPITAHIKKEREVRAGPAWAASRLDPRAKFCSTSRARRSVWPRVKLTATGQLGHPWHEPASPRSGPLSALQNGPHAVAGCPEWDILHGGEKLAKPVTRSAARHSSLFLRATLCTAKS